VSRVKKEPTTMNPHEKMTCGESTLEKRNVKAELYCGTAPGAGKSILANLKEKNEGQKKWESGKGNSEDDSGGMYFKRRGDP